MTASGRYASTAVPVDSGLRISRAAVAHRPDAERGDHVTGHFEASLEETLRGHSDLVSSIARELVRTNFPGTVAPDVLEAVGLDPETVLAAAGTLADSAGGVPPLRRRDSSGRLVFTARTEAGHAVYALHDRKLTPRLGTIVPVTAHVSWHAHEVFKGEPLAS